MTPDLSILVLSWNTLELTRACLGALRSCAGASPLSYEVIVIDNASEDGSSDMIRDEFPGVGLYRNGQNLGYAQGVNQGIRLATGRFVVLLGSDTEVRSGTLETMASFLDANPRVGAAAPRCVDPDGTLQRGCMRFPNINTALFFDTAFEARWPDHPILSRYFYREWSHLGSRRVDQPPGTCLMVKREVIDQVGPMDRRLWLFFNDVDWCIRIRRAGWDLWYVDDGTEVLHHRGASTKLLPTFPVEWHRNRLIFYRKHYHWLGAVVCKLALVYISLRELTRLRRNLESTREFFKHARQVLGATMRVLVM